MNKIDSTLMDSNIIDSTFLVTGAGGVIGMPLMKRLSDNKINYLSISRKRSDERTILCDLESALSAEIITRLKNIDAVIHTAPLWLLPKHIPDLGKQGIKRIIAFSSSSIVGKSKTTDSNESQLVKALSQAEKELDELCGKYKIELTVFRPTMIYGYGRDQNVTHLAKIIRRYRLMILVGQAQGLRQPVHADDLVDACFAVLNNPKSYGKTYNLAGAEALTYYDMVVAIFEALNIKPRIVSSPLWLFRCILKLATLTGKFSYTADMADRMNQDLNYEYSDAEADFGFSPQRFLTQPSRDLVIE